MTAELPLPLKGIIPPMATPLSDRDALDETGLERLVEHILSGGVHGLFVLGTTGEAPSLSVGTRRQLIERTLDYVSGRVPVLVGVTDTSLGESLSLARFAAEAGAAAVVLAPPPYFPVHQRDLLAYLSEFADGSPLPVVLYNIPSHARNIISRETVEALLDVQNIVGLKESSADMIAFHRYLELFRSRPDFSLLMGPEELLAESVLLGGHGGICGGANIVPSLYVELYEAAVTGDLRLVHQLQQRVMRISNTLYQVGDAPSGYLTGLKCALGCLGICSDRPAEPYHRLNSEQRRAIEQHLRDLELFESADVLPAATSRA
jgi:dihydrodipicolinate synthase/N-acetylneuraminate lyase